MSIAYRTFSGPKADVVRGPKRDYGMADADTTSAYRLVRYDQCIRLYDAGFSMARIGSLLGYTRQHVHRIITGMREARREFGGDRDADD